MKADKVVGLALDRAALQYERDHRVSYREALEAVMHDNPTLAAEYVAEFSNVSPRQARQLGLDDAGARTGKPWQSPSGYSSFDMPEEDGADEKGKRASATVDAMVKQIQKEHPDWTIEKCVAEAKDRMKKKAVKEAERGVRIAELAQEIQTARDRVTALLSA